MGGTVEVEFNETFMEKQHGVIVEYAPRGAHAVVVLTSVNEIQKIPAIYDVSCLKPIPEVFETPRRIHFIRLHSIQLSSRFRRIH